MTDKIEEIEYTGGGSYFDVNGNEWCNSETEIFEVCEKLNEVIRKVNKDSKDIYNQGYKDGYKDSASDHPKLQPPTPFNSNYIAMNKQQTERLIEFLSDKAGYIRTMNDNGVLTQESVISSFILIGDVLERIDEVIGGRNSYVGQTSYCDELLHLWAKCGFTKSIQEIVEESGYENVSDLVYRESGENVNIGKLKDPSTSALIEFLISIFNLNE